MEELILNSRPVSVIQNSLNALTGYITVSNISESHQSNMVNVHILPDSMNFIGILLPIDMYRDGNVTFHTDGSLASSVYSANISLSCRMGWLHNVFNGLHYRAIGGISDSLSIIVATPHAFTTSTLDISIEKGVTMDETDEIHMLLGILSATTAILVLGNLLMCSWICCPRGSQIQTAQ